MVRRLPGVASGREAVAAACGFADSHLSQPSHDATIRVALPYRLQIGTTMSSILPQSSLLPVDWSLANLQDHLGGVSLERIRLFPSPGTATERDLEAILDRENCTCELIDGVLVEKSMGFFE